MATAISLSELVLSSTLASGQKLLEHLATKRPAAQQTFMQEVGSGLYQCVACPFSSACFNSINSHVLLSHFGPRRTRGSLGEKRGVRRSHQQGEVNRVASAGRFE